MPLCQKESKRLRGLWVDEEIFSRVGCEWIGRVHSVYAHAMNILAPDHQLYTLVDSTLDPAPRTIVVDGVTPFEGMTPGARVVFRKKFMRIGEQLIVDLSGAKPWSGSLKSKATFDVNILMRNIQVWEQNYLPRLKSYGCAHYYQRRRGIGPTKMGIVEEMLACRIDRLIREIRTGLPSELAITGLVGLGRGLTPSGDDFLAGFLWTSRVLAPEERWYKRVVEVLKRLDADTTEVSKQMLLTATEGVARQRIKDFIDMMMSNKHINENIINSVLAIGSTSGADQMIGMLLAMKVVGSSKDRRCNDDEKNDGSRECVL